MPELTNEEIAKWLEEDDDFGTEDEINEAIAIQESITLLRFWSQINNDVKSTKIAYRLAKQWEDENLIKNHLEQGKQLISRIKVVEDELKVALPKTRGNQFLTPDDRKQLPKWMLKLVDNA